jgi:trk system potassium uptake protein
MHLGKDLRLLASILIFLAALMLIPLSVSIYFDEMPAVKAFLLTIGIMIAANSVVLILTRKETLSGLMPKDGCLFVVFTWILAAAFGALPLVLSGNVPSYSTAYFEIMSGFTTTGATALSDVEACYKGILFWRSMTNWLGGMGIVVLFVALLPAIGAGSKMGAGSFLLLGTESVGPVKGKLTPKTKSTAKILWLIYFGLSFLQFVLLKLGGMGYFDAVTITFSSISTAGFSVKNASIGAYNSAYVDAVVTAFMLLGGINFSLYYKAFTGKIKQSLKDSELRWYLSIWFVCAALGAIQLTAKHIYPNLLVAFRYTSFNVASILTTTGFSSTNYLAWPTFAVMLVVITMFVGGCAGSTGGGMKVIRVSTIFKMGKRSIKQNLHPSAVCTIKTSDGTMDDDTLSSIATFVAMYLATWIISSVVVALCGTDIETCLSSTLLCLGNIGIGFGQTGPTGSFAIFPSWAKWLFSSLMLVGRLELFTVYCLFTKSFWKR